jgi:hypothetical protein
LHSDATGALQVAHDALGSDGGHVLVRLMDALGDLVTLPHAVLARLKGMRGRGESYSDVILRIAAPFAARP